MTTAIAPRHEYMDSRQAAVYLGISANTLNCWRSRREGPPFVKVGGKVRYRLADVDAWADGRRRDPSSQR
jgi:excisionase family DNA binding protein